MSPQTSPLPDTPGTVVPYLIIRNAARAIDFYKHAFGAQEMYARITDSLGRVGHAEIRIGGSTIMLADEHPEIGCVSPATLGGSPLSFVLNVPDADASVKHALAAGGTLSRPLENKFYGHRSGEITDPFGYRWTVSTKIEDVPEEEIQRRAAEEERKRRQ
jgi:PhnB protein